MRNLAPTLAFSTALCLIGCASVPSMDLAQDATQPPPASVRIINQIACEISGAGGFADLREKGYAISAVVTMKVKDKGALTPSVSVIDFFGRSGNSYTSTVGGELSRSRTRTFTQTFTIHARELRCEPNVSHRFQGSLGLADVIATGLYPLPDGVNLLGAEAAPAPRLRSFASTIEFELTRSLNGGPQWIRPLFKGPGAGLLGLSRTDTDTLVISFGPPKDKSKDPEAADESARRQSLDLLQIMILQNLNLAH